MDVLIKYGFTIEEIKNIMDSNLDFDSVDDNDVYRLIDLLGSIGCLNNHIKNIFITNPFIFNNKVTDIEKNINFLTSIGLKNLYILFDSNPYLFNVSYDELNKMYKDLKKDKLSDDEIINYLNYKLVEVI